MNFCSVCGTKLEKRECAEEGIVPYCTTCKEFRFPTFSSAVSMIVLNPTLDKILLIQQYQRSDNILVAGYVNKGECLEETLYRECLEEIGRKVVAHQYLRSEYFEKSNTLLCNFAVIVDDEDLSSISKREVDHAAWYLYEEAKQAIKPDSLAKRFLLYYLEQFEKGNIHLKKAKD